MMVDKCDWCQKVANFQPETGQGESLTLVGIDQYVCNDCLTSARKCLGLNPPPLRPKHRSIDDDWISLSFSRASG